MASMPLGRAAFAHPSPESGQWGNVRQMIDTYVGEGRVANMVAALGWGQAAPGYIERGPLSIGKKGDAGPDSLYRIYSMTKPVTGMATMILIDEGKLGLDQPLYDLIPAFSEMMVQKEYDGAITADNLEPAKRPITIRHLLTHTAGLGYSITQEGPIKTAYEEQGLLPGQVTKLHLPGTLGADATVRSLSLFAERLATVPLVAQPGTKWSYSVSLDLLGRVIEIASGKSFEAFLQERFFDPLGMTSTWFQVPQSEVWRMTTNYGIMDGNLLPLDPAAASIYLDEPAFAMGGAGLVSSPRDFDRFLQMIVGLGAVEGRRVMSERAVQIGVSNLLPEGVSTDGTWAAGAGFGAGGRSGLGAQEGTYGWGGAAGTVAFADVKRGLRAGLYTQYMPSETYPVSNDFIGAVTSDLMAMAEAA